MPDRERDLPPLDAEEAQVLAANLLISQLIMLAIGIAGSAVAEGVRSGDWMQATVGLGWLRSIAGSLASRPAAETLALGCLVAVALAFVAWAGERRALSTERGRASVLKSRRGVNGELARLPLAVLVPAMLLTGFAEELLFRFALMGLALAALAPVLPAPAAAGVALLVSSTAFWLAHARYRDPTTAVLTLALGLSLGALFLGSGSLAVAALAHALYDLIVLMASRRQMRRDPGYFGGPAPTRALLDQLEEQEGPA